MKTTVVVKSIKPALSQQLSRPLVRSEQSQGCFPAASFAQNISASSQSMTLWFLFLQQSPSRGGGSLMD